MSTPLNAAPPPAARPISRDEWQLSAGEVHSRQSLSGFALSPDGCQLVLVQVRDRRTEEDRDGKRIKDTTLADVCLLPADGGYPRPFTTTGNVSQPAVWSPDGQRLLLERAGTLCSVPLGGGKPQIVYRGTIERPHLGAGDAHLGGPRWSPDGSWLLIATREDSQTLLILLSADGGAQRRLLAIDGYLASWDWSPDGRQVVVVTQSEDAWVGDVRLIDVASGQSRVLWNEANYPYQKPVAAWSPAGARIVFRSNRSGWSKLWTVVVDGLTDAKGSDAQPLTTGTWDDYAFRFSPDGKQVVFASRAEQTGSGDDLWIVPLAGGTATRLTRHAGVNVPYGWAPDGRVLYWHSSPAGPGDLWAVTAPTSGGSANPGSPARPPVGSAESGGPAGPGDGHPAPAVLAGSGPSGAPVSDRVQPRRLTWSAPVELVRKLRPPEEVVITGAEGQRMTALVYLPADHQEGRRYPPIVWMRGGPTGFSRYDYAPLLTWLANQGYVVITPNYRGSIGHGIDFMEAVAGDGLGKHDLADVLAAAAYVREHPAANTQRGVGVGGRSWGGYLTLLAVSQAPDAFSCAVAGAAISDWMVQQAQTEVRHYDRWLVGGWLYEQEARARDRSPVTHAGNIKTPLLVYHGEADKDVPFAQIGPFVEQARQAGASVDYVTYPLEGHGNRLPKNQQDVLNRTRAFFRRHLQPWNFRDNPTGDQVP